MKNYYNCPKPPHDLLTSCKTIEPCRATHKAKPSKCCKNHSGETKMCCTAYTYLRKFLPKTGEIFAIKTSRNVKIVFNRREMGVTFLLCCLNKCVKYNFNVHINEVNYIATHIT